MKEIIFATGNSGKIATLKSHLALAGLDIDVAQQPLELIEPQAATATEVAKVKAQQAYDLLQKPVLVDDSSFHIYALGGFPGPYIKYMLETVGVDGIIKFMEGQNDRRAHFMSSLVFIDEHGTAHVFEGKDPDGEIIDHVDTNDHPEAWSELWKIFAPPGRGGKTYSQLTHEELRQHRRGDKKDSAYTQFTAWLKSVY
jgi:XTP/dITP diphosphohydrolase